MTINVLFAGVAVADFARAAAWYPTLFGRPPDVVVNDNEVMWKVADAGWIYVVQDTERAGHALVALSVDDLDAVIAELADRGVRGGAIEFVGDAGRKSVFTDPEGNRIAFIQVAPSEE